MFKQIEIFFFLQINNFINFIKRKFIKCFAEMYFDEQSRM